ncbi:CoA-binding domain protein [Desulfatibacillum aliphaticivorans]|uniref:CoA-binding domain protein n=1 Tax=Desulfatibacillum aliphaticivorans TaxID=218208 RepID=B8FGY7_DESAL|nr:acetate--CoA ligase family protein [Desulfatibacillum aliphaticivorans]ACL02075.1 CoA-binding domain protein [Desulfatibacillum aliphaticivorans]
MNTSRNPLHTIMAPKSVAIVGASANPMKMGSMQFLNILHCGFPGTAIPVHPKHEEIFGVKAYPSISSLPDTPELAVLVVPTGLVINMLDEFGKLGTKHAIIISAGFREMGADGKILEKQLLETADKHGIRFLGPNCMGVFNSQYPFNATVTPFQDKPGFLSIASQSGTYLAQTLTYLKYRGVRLNQAMSVGNEANINIVDCLEYLGEDPKTKAIGLYIEALSDPGRFLEVAREVSRVKPIVAQYVGGSKAGAKSGLSHTGSIAGPDFLYNGLFEQAGVIRVHSIEDVYKVGHVLATQPGIKGNRVAVLTHSGGPGSGMCDTADRQGLVVEELPDDVQDKIRAVIPPTASPKNPVDLTFIVDSKPLSQIIPQILLECDEVDGLLIHGIMDTGWAKVTAGTLGKALGVSEEDMVKLTKSDLTSFLQLKEKYGKPVLVGSFMGDEDNARNVMMDNFIPVFSSPEKAAFSMGCLYKHHLIKTRPYSKAEKPQGLGKNTASILAQAKGPLDEFQAKRILADYGIPVSPESLASSRDDAVQAAESLGYPVVIKACSPDILHKTEKGLVKLNLGNPQEAAEAYDAIQEGAPGVPVIVGKMLPVQREFMAGITRFEGYPPCVLFGMGGVLAEALKDFSLRLAPMTQAEALAMIDSLKSSVLLDDFRNMGAVDREALASMLVNLGYLAMDFPEIKEIDLNPILIMDGKPVAADALIVL